MENISVIHSRVIKYKAEEVNETDDELAIEEPLEIQLKYYSSGSWLIKNISVTMRTPGNDEELALGFLFTEGIIQNRNQIFQVNVFPEDENKILLTLCDNETPRLEKAERNFYATSSCGVCGKSSIDAIRTISLYKNVHDKIRVDTALIYKLENSLRKRQVVFDCTGGLHASALFDLEGKIMILREDVGRHNALDKVIGAAFLDNQLPLSHSILLLSGRASFELVQKAVMAGIKIIAAVGAPSSLAVQLAKEEGITLIGFLRDNRFNVYCGEQRIINIKTQRSQRIHKEH